MFNRVLLDANLPNEKQNMLASAFWLTPWHYYYTIITVTPTTAVNIITIFD